MEDVFAIFHIAYLLTLSTSNVSDEWKSRHCLHDHGGFSSSHGHDERPSWTIKVILHVYDENRIFPIWAILKHINK